MSTQALTVGSEVPPETQQEIAIPAQSVLDKIQRYLHTLKEDGWGVPDLGFVTAGAIVALYAVIIAIKLKILGTTETNFREFVYPFAVGIILGLIGLLISCIRQARSDDDVPANPEA